MARPKKQADSMLEHVIENETSNEKYFKYWMRFIGKDFREKRTGKVLTKGEFYRKYPDIAEALSDEDVKLDSKFELIEKRIKTTQPC